MSILKYKNYLIIYLIVLISFALLGIILGLRTESSGFIRFSPFDNAGFDTVYVFVMISVASIIGGVLMGYILGPLYLVVHKRVIGRKMVYGIQDKPKSEKFKGIFLMALFPALLTVNFALMFAFNSTVQNIALDDPEQQDAAMITFATLLALTTGISMGLFSPVWFLLDAGIVFTNKEKVRYTAHPTEVRSVGGWYIYLLKGYAGISVILSYYAFFIFLWQGRDVGTGLEGMSLMFFATWPIMPLLIALLTIPAFILLDITREHRKKFILKWAKKFGISGPLENPLDTT
ncbi:MAG: hypothetical protein ACFFAN_05830 [Promethearchaeota archaeon]